MKTELKDCLHHYLNTGLKIQAKGGMIYTLNFEIYNLTIISGWKPLLLPMSALTEPLEDGTIPIVELARIATNFVFGNLLDFTKAELFSELDSSGLVVYYESKERVSFTADFDCTRKDFSLYSDGNSLNLDKLALFEYLFKHHFNVFDLAPELWIDKRTVK